jgi:hypothetical protein
MFLVIDILLSPERAMAANNTDHMHGLDTNRAMNPYNPFLAMSVAGTRKTEAAA